MPLPIATLETTPAIAPPPGVRPELTSPESRAPLQSRVMSVLLALALSFVFNRIYVKLWLMRRFTWDDSTLFVSVLSSLAFYITCISENYHGFRVHLWDISMAQIERDDLHTQIVLILVESLLNPITFFFLKSTFFILYLQLFSHHSTMLRRICQLGLLLTVTTYIIFTILTGLRVPRSFIHSYMVLVPLHDLKGFHTFFIAQSVVGLLFDLAILLLPVCVVSRLRMSWGRKTGVLIIFLTGAMACVCSACSIYYRFVVFQSTDMLWDNVPLNITTMAEMFIGIIVACMPAVAYSARYHNASVQKFLTPLATRFRSNPHQWTSVESRKSNLVQTQSTKTKCPEPAVLRSTDKKYAQYLSDVNTSIVTSQHPHDEMEMSETRTLNSSMDKPLLRNV